MVRTVIVLATVFSTAVVSAQDLESALNLTRQLVEEHRYEEIIELLAPFDPPDDPEARYAVAAELGRAYFHLGDYATADGWFREAVGLRPRRVETALYLQATSYLIGNREQAYAIFRELVASGAKDLYLAVSLPGERLFLADPKVWSILDELATDVTVDIDRGALLGVEMGLARTLVEERLGAGPADQGSALTARAGPYLIWVFGFDESEKLAQIMLHNEHLSRYTPYRIRLVGDLDWRSTPSVATSELGAPTSTTTTDDGLVMMIWNREAIRLTLEFAIPRQPAPPGVDPSAPSLRVVRLEARREP